MSRFSGVALERHEASGGEAFEYGIDLAGGTERDQVVTDDAPLGIRGPVTRLDHAEQHGSQNFALAVIEAVVDVLCTLGESAVGASGLPVAGDGEGATLATQPGLAQGMRDEG